LWREGAKGIKKRKSYRGKDASNNEATRVFGYIISDGHTAVAAEGALLQHFEWQPACGSTLPQSVACLLLRRGPTTVYIVLIMKT
jgi:hypothetical protein